ncbi:hypothetical protein PUMCH_003801 [Australozyma saopauloensis]|uniref:mRNA export factor MEX67 n=1 Tax=Australozyma saopauloensis TaxID=291208 RepID=A0AAX4HCU0_9ASCO|nr:hypothetical protein PUMCH_003801 [[Candida] saopauloensis]
MSNFNRANFGARNTNSPTQQTVKILILGWTNALAEDCIAFVKKKTRVQVTNYHTEQQVLYGTVRNNQEAQTLVQHNGVRFAGQGLKFKIEEAGKKEDGPAFVVLTNLIKSRYDPQSQFLNLAGVINEPTVQSIGFLQSAGAAARFFPALLLVADQAKIEVTSADFSNNDISDLERLSLLPKNFPRLRNLSLQNNRLANTNAFERWKKNLVHLREILIDGNPLMNRVSPVDLRTQFKKIFPRLIVLNGELVRNEEVALANLKLAFDAPQPIFFQDSDVQNISTSFITNFVSLWDSDRTALMGLFQPQSQFSLQVDSTTPQVGNQDLPDFGYYLTHSRNLSKVLVPKARMSKLAIGAEQIFNSFSQIPKTKHDLVNNPSAYSMEAYKLPQMGAICITLHGSFQEVAAPDKTEKVNHSSRYKGNNKKLRPQLGSKSFDRTFIVVPGANNSMVVASDMLCLRAPVDSDAFQGTPNVPSTPAMPASPAAAVPGSVPHSGTATPTPVGQFNIPDELKNTLNPLQQELLAKVLVETKLTVDYGLMLCQQSNWDYQQCVVNFSNSSGSLPPNAFA